MFDLAFDSLIAYNQVAYMMAAFVLIGLGLLILGNIIYWRTKALRVKGTVIGVRKDNSKDIFFPVYRYTMPDGAVIEATSDTGSNMLSGMETGAEIDLMVFAKEPEKVSPLKAKFLTIIGLVLFLMGFVFMYVALTSYKVTPMTGVMGAAFVIYIALKIKKIIIPKEQRAPSVQAWQEKKREKRQAEFAAMTFGKLEDFLEQPNFVAQRQQTQKAAGYMCPIFALVAVGLFYGSIYFYKKNETLENDGTKTTGTVVQMIEQRNTDGDYTYRPLIQFNDAQNNSVEFKGGVASNPPMYDTGESVNVMYMKDSPQETATIDRGIYNLFLPLALLLGCFGAIGISRHQFRIARAAQTR